MPANAVLIGSAADRGASVAVEALRSRGRAVACWQSCPSCPRQCRLPGVRTTLGCLSCNKLRTTNKMSTACCVAGGPLGTMAASEFLLN